MEKLKDLNKIADACLEGMDVSEAARENIRAKVKTKKRNYRPFVIGAFPAAAVVLIVTILLNMNGYSELHVKAKDLMKDIKPSVHGVGSKSTDKYTDSVNDGNEFVNATADFSVNLFKQARTENENSLISPLSAYFALAMTANGASGQTRKEFETVLGGDINTINENCYDLLSYLNSGETNVANSIWFRQDYEMMVKKSFLQKNADYYNANAYAADFESKGTVDDINNWVNEKTKGLIDSIIDRINRNTVMYLFNTLYFEADWQEKFKKDHIETGAFYPENSKVISAEFMSSTEYGYIEDENVKGFIKPYKGNKYSFVALLPNEDVDSYVNSLTGEKMMSLIKNKTNEEVQISLPKFKMDYSKELNDALNSMGLKTGFSPNGLADFQDMVSSNDVYIGEVLQKTYIEVDSSGTKAGAVTKVEMVPLCSPVELKEVRLDRPFVYAIIDNRTNLPLFIGTLHNPEE